MSVALRRPPGEVRNQWSKRLVLWVVVLLLANVLADVVIGAPLMVLPELLDRFDTDQAAWLNVGAMLAGAIWSPLLAKSSDIAGKRRVLVITLLVAGAGALICLVAPNLWTFLVGRFLQGAGFGSVFLTVALVREISAPPVGMTLVGLLTSGASVVGVLEPFLMKPVVDAYGYRGVFTVAALLAAGAALGVRCLVPESPVRAGSRVDVAGGVLLGGGVGALLAYLTLARSVGWSDGRMIALGLAGIAALALWAVSSLRLAEPIVDLRALHRPVVLTLVALLLAAGAFRSVLHLIGIVAHVPADLGLGYGLGDGEAIALLLAVPNLGIVVGGVCAGWLSGRHSGPALPLLGGIALGTIAAVTMLAGVSALPLAVGCAGMLGVAAGAIGASGYNLAMDHAAPAQHGTIAGLVSVTLALGSVVVTFAGGEVLKATESAAVISGGAPVSTAFGVYLYVAMAGACFALAAIPAAMVWRTRSTARGAAPGSGGDR
ncbi:MFS transporter [Mycolicibacterium parafortuitum]